MLNIKQPAMTTGAREADMAKRRIFRAILPDGTEIKRTSTSRAYAWAVTGKWPDGLTRPVSTLAIAAPPFDPGYQASTIAGTRAAHGMATPALVSSTTDVRGLAATTASINAS